MIGNNRIIAVCMSKVHDKNRFEHIRAMNEYFQECGYRMFVYQTCSDLYWQTKNEYGERCIFNLMDFQIIDAVILFCEAICDEVLMDSICRQAKEHNKPVILVSGSREGCIEISHDYGKSFERMVRHVIEDHDVKDVHLVAGIKENVYSDEREAVFRKVAAENGIAVDDSMVSYGRFWNKPAERAVERLIAEKRVPKAILCVNDVMAIAACDVLRKHGYSIPGDVIVTGFDGIEETRYANPTVSTCEKDAGAISKQITEVLRRIFAGEPYEFSYKIPGKMHLYESCGCRRIGKAMLNPAVAMRWSADLLGKAQQVERKLHEIATKVQVCKKVVQLPSVLREMPVSDICIVLNEEATDEKIDPNVFVTGSAYDDNLCLIYQSDMAEENYALTFPKDRILPNLKAILNKGTPLIFTPINFLDKALGFTCCYFEVKYENYCMIPQITIGMDNAIVGFRNLRYQSYMTRMVEKMYQLDGLTGLYNRVGFYREVEEVYKKVLSQEDNRLTVISVDVNKLKYINDTFGHEEGDVAIVTVARALKDCWPEDKICVRFGGDEMLAVFAHDKREEVEERIIQDFKGRLARFNQNVKKPYDLGASIGIATSDTNETDFQRLLEISDKKMYRDKANS